MKASELVQPGKQVGTVFDLPLLIMEKKTAMPYPH